MRRLAALSLLVLGACAAREAPERRRPLFASSEPTIAVVASAPPAPVISGAVSIDLPSVLALAGEKPNTIRLARERLALADALEDTSLAGLLPSLVVGGRFQRHNGTIQDVGGSFIETTKQDTFLGGAGEVVLDASGVFAYLRERQRREAASADLEAATNEGAGRAAAGYFELQGAEAEVEIARDALVHARAFEEIAASRERNKVGIALDTLRAQAEVARARQGVILSEERARVASIRLATLLRLDATVTLHAADDRVRPVTFVAPETPVAKLVETALAGHPDIHAAERRVYAADLEDDAARLGPFVPLVRAGVGGLGGGLGYDGTNFGALRDREDYYMAVELHLDGLGLGEVARARAAGARLRAERVRADDVKDEVIRLVLEAREAVRARSAAIQVARDELDAASEARTIAEKRLEQGTGIALDVIAAEDERTRAASRLVQAIVGYDAAQYALLVRLGEPPPR